MMKNYRMTTRLTMVLTCLMMSFGALAQTTLINPATDGGFENGGSFALNGWNVSNIANNPWVVGTAVSNGPIAGNSAYISNDGGVSNAYGNTAIANNFFWKDITVPAGESKIVLTFNWLCQGESTWDNWQVFSAPTSVNPTSTTTYPGNGASNVPAGIAGATFVGNGNLQGTVQTSTFYLSPALAGTTFRLIFSWKNDGSGGIQPPAVIDNISLISSVPGTFISVVTGNWNTPATWDANAVPSPVDNAIVDIGHVVTIDAAGLSINDLTVRGTLAYGATPTTFSVNGNLTVDAGGLFNVFNAATGKTLLVSKNIINNGAINLSVGTTTAGNLTLNGTSVQSVSGSGVFTNDFIRNLTFSNTNTSIPNINWTINAKIAYNLNLTGARINLGTSKITFGNLAAGNTLTAPVGTGFLPGSKFSRWWTATATGTGIIAGTDPTNTTSRYPFLNTTGQNRAMYISRSSSVATGNTAGELAVVYTDGVGMTSSLSIADGAYTITDRYNGYWNVTTEGSGYVYVSGTHTAVAIASGAYAASNGNSRILTDNAAIGGTHQNGTTTPGVQRTGIITSDLTIATGLYIGANTIDIIAACSGTPTGGTTTGPASVCSGVNFGLSLTGATSGVTGLTYQWQSSPDGVTYSNIGGATAATYTANQTGVTYYQCIVTCTNSGMSATSTPLQVNMNVPTACYCAVTFPSGVEPITLVNFGSINNTTSPVVNGTPALEDFTSMTTNVARGSTGIITVKGNTDGNWTTRIAAYVDWNQDGDFLDAGEFFDLGSITNSTGVDAIQTTGNIIVPINAMLGNTRMRVIKKYNTIPASCESLGFGQAEDYTLNVICPVLPAPTVTGATICSGNTATTSATATISGSTLTWFDASTGGTNLGTGATYTTGALSSTTSYWVEESIPGCPASARAEAIVTVNALPTVTASSDDADNTVCNGTMVTLTGGGASTYTWSGGVTDATAFAATSTTTYTVTGTDVNSCQNTAMLTLTVNALPTVTATSDDADNTVCNGTMVTLTGTGTATGYTWSGGVMDATAFAATSTTTYTVTGTDGNGCMNTDMITITVNTLPTVTASSDAVGNMVCDGDMVTLTGTGTATGYTWTGGVMDATAFTPTMTDTYIVTGTDANGCMNTDMITITVNTLPTVTASSDAAGNMVCDGDMVTLTGGGATSYLWTGGVMDATAFTPTMTDTYTVTGTDGNGCMNTDMITITVNTLPTVTASSDATNDEVCAGLMVTLNGGGADTYVWTGGVNDGASFAPSMTDTYTVTGTDLNGCEGTASITITVNTLPTVDLAPFATSVCDNGGPVSLVDGTPTGGMFSGLGVTGSTFDPSVTGAGMWTITYTVTDGNGCNNSDSEVLTVDLCTGIASNESQVISLYPNPTTGMFTLNINNSNANQVVITILDMQGKVVFNESDKNVSNQYNKQIDLSDLAKGIYYVKLNIGADVKIEKLIVQ